MTILKKEKKKKKKKKKDNLLNFTHIMPVLEEGSGGNSNCHVR
jgi:hypothetical protein